MSRRLFSPWNSDNRTYIRLYDKHPVSGLLEEIQPEDINDAELISYLIYIEQVEKGGRKVKFKDLDLTLEYGKTHGLDALVFWLWVALGIIFISFQVSAQSTGHVTYIIPQPSHLTHLIFYLVRIGAWGICRETYLKRNCAGVSYLELVVVNWLPLPPSISGNHSFNRSCSSKMREDSRIAVFNCPLCHRQSIALSFMLYFSNTLNNDMFRPSGGG